MNTETGFISHIPEEIPEEKRTGLTQEEYEALMKFHEHERPKLLHNMRSKNHSAKKRARKKIASASRRRNRK